jgi:hypothetical protein
MASGLSHILWKIIQPCSSHHQAVESSLFITKKNDPPGEIPTKSQEIPIFFPPNFGLHLSRNNWELGDFRRFSNTPVKDSPVFTAVLESPGGWFFPPQKGPKKHGKT